MRISNICRIKNNNSVRRVAWHTKCDHEVSFHFSAFIFSQFSWTHSMRHIQNTAEKQNINVEKMLFTSRLWVMK